MNILENEIFDQIYVHKPDWNNFYKILEKFFCPISPIFVLWLWPIIFGPQNDTILTILTKNDGFWPN